MNIFKKKRFYVIILLVLLILLTGGWLRLPQPVQPYIQLAGEVFPYSTFPLAA
jgi:hypothetical protein